MLSYIKKIKKLRKEKLFSICLAESCTGGMISSKLTSISGSSDFFDGSVVSYSNDLKNRLLKVPKTTISKYGAVSHQTALSMVKGLRKISQSEILVSVTGVAGPKGGTNQKPVGLVYIGIKKGKKTLVKKNYFKSNKRRLIQKATVNKALNLILSFAK